jgi:hypothetical protein
VEIKDADSWGPLGDPYPGDDQHLARYKGASVVDHNGDGFLVAKCARSDDMYLVKLATGDLVHHSTAAYPVWLTPNSF